MLHYNWIYNDNALTFQLINRIVRIVAYNDNVSVKGPLS